MLTAGDSLTALMAYKKSDMADLYTVTEKSETSTLMKSTGTVYTPESSPLSQRVGAEASRSNVLITPKINVTNVLTHIQPTHTETEPIFNALNSQPWSTENNTALAHMPNLPVNTTHPIIDMDNTVTSSVMVELNSTISGPQWPDDINPETLVSELLGHSSNIYVRLKRHTCGVQKCMHFLTEGVSFVPSGVLDAYVELQRN